MASATYDANGTFTVPAAVTSITVECWGSGGKGGASKSWAHGTWSGGGGGGGAYARKTVAVTPGAQYAIIVGAGGGTTKTSFGGTLVVADFGTNGTDSPG